MFQIARVAPELAEYLGENNAVFWAGNKAGLKNVEEVWFSAEANCLHRADGINHTACPQRNTSRTERTRKPRYVVGELAVFRDIQGEELGHLVSQLFAQSQFV